MQFGFILLICLMPLANLSRAPSAPRLKDKARLCLVQSRGKTLTTEWDYCLSAQGRTIHFDKETRLTAKVRSQLNTLWGMWLICNLFFWEVLGCKQTHTHTFTKMENRWSEWLHPHLPSHFFHLQIRFTDWIYLWLCSGEKTVSFTCSWIQCVHVYHGNICGQN